MRPKTITDATRNYIFSEALEKYYQQGSSIGNKVSLLVQMLESDGSKGRAWVAEQLFGRAKSVDESITEEETVETTTEKSMPIITWAK